MKTFITKKAQTDLREIALFIARDSPRRAVTFINELTRKCEEIALMAEAFPLVEGREHHGLRRRVYKNYLIFYYVKNNRVLIVHVLNGARQTDRLNFSIE